jgi:flavin reductase (DIM6/NTAB) family NADH-FMN oxidoreductase RutF
MYSWAMITGDTPTTTDAFSFRQSLGCFPTGVCLVTTVTGSGRREGMTINSFSSVSLDPPLILWSIRNDARSADAFIGSQHFIVSVLAASQRELAQHFARGAPDKFAPLENAFEAGLGGCPRLRHSAATFECATYSRHAEGDHTILLGRVDRHIRTTVPAIILHQGQMGSLWDLAQSAADPR